MVMESDNFPSIRTTGLVPGDLVRVEVTSHEPWGVIIWIIGYGHICASVDGVVIDSPHPRTEPEDHPAIGTERSAVVIRLREDGKSPWVYLSMLHTDILRPFRRAKQ